MEYNGIVYGCVVDSKQKYEHHYHYLAIKWEPIVFGSPSESFSLFSFWLGRDSDALLEWPPEPKAKDWDHSFLYAG
jgi:hypothetical protein